MKIRSLHPWVLTAPEAVAVQCALCRQVRCTDDLGPVRHVAGADVGYEENGRMARAAVVVLAYPGLERVDAAVAHVPNSFPYLPGLLSFREIPAVIEALRGLTLLPDLILYDGQGIAHPRRMGIASHLGLLADVPTIGVAKTRLLGQHEAVPNERGAWVPLIDGDEIIGAVLRTQAGVKPLYVSIGHRVSLATAIRWVLACTTRYRLPETTRWAHHLASGSGPGCPAAGGARSYQPLPRGSKHHTSGSG